MRRAQQGLEELRRHVDTIIVIPNQNLFKIANEQTTFEESFNLSNHVLMHGVQSITDLMVRPGLINLDFADVESVMAMTDSTSAKSKFINPGLTIKSVML